MTGKERDDDGRIPFRIRIGVTGHKDVGHGGLIEAALKEQIRRLYDLFPSPDTEVRLSVVSQLADGADRLVVLDVQAEAEERGHEARLEAILPLHYEDYVAVQKFSDSSREQLDRLLGKAVVQSAPTGRLGDLSGSHGPAYEAAGHQVVARCDVLIALWDGKRSGGKGGTARTLLYAAARSKPCIWISTGAEPLVRDNFDPGQAAPFHREVEERAEGEIDAASGPASYPRDSLEVLRRSFVALDEFNREAVPANFESRLRSELTSRSGVDDWVAAPFVRATTLAARWRSRFAWAARIITLSAALAAAALAVGLSYGEKSEIWSEAEATLFLLALLGIGIIRKAGFHRRWLTYRVLAERLRTAHFLAPTGIDFRRQARLEGVYVDGQATDWVMRAFEEVWDRRPKPPVDLATLAPELLAELKRTLADDWIGKQITYHEQASKRHRHAYLRLAIPIVALFIATIAFAVLHAHHMFENEAIFFSVALPAAGASLGVMLTVNQHQALSERYARMQSDLRVARANILNATPDTLGKASSEAARVIAQETGAWFGSMWFLDIEHP
jgi:SMODS and SLOG-associating 2TM effector domain 1